MKLDLWGIYSIMKIEWYCLTFKHKFMILSIKLVMEMKKTDFLKKVQFLGGAIDEKMHQIKN